MISVFVTSGYRVFARETTYGIPNKSIYRSPGGVSVKRQVEVV